VKASRWADPGYTAIPGQQRQRWGKLSVLYFFSEFSLM